MRLTLSSKAQQDDYIQYVVLIEGSVPKRAPVKKGSKTSGAVIAKRRREKKMEGLKSTKRSKEEKRCFVEVTRQSVHGNWNRTPNVVCRKKSCNGIITLSGEEKSPFRNAVAKTERATKRYQTVKTNE